MLEMGYLPNDFLKSYFTYITVKFLVDDFIFVHNLCYQTAMHKFFRVVDEVCMNGLFCTY